MTTYDKDKVDALLDQIAEWKNVRILNYPEVRRIFDIAADLRPKPAKFYVMPEWETLVYPNTKADVVLVNDDRDVVYKSIYNALRNLTATDKPMVHIPAGKDWSFEDTSDLVSRCGELSPQFRTLIDAIKEKLEGGK